MLRPFSVWAPDMSFLEERGHLSRWVGEGGIMRLAWRPHMASRDCSWGMRKPDRGNALCPWLLGKENHLVGSLTEFRNPFFQDLCFYRRYGNHCELLLALIFQLIVPVFVFQLSRDLCN